MYNYLEALKNDVREVMEDQGEFLGWNELDHDELFDEVYDYCFTCDAVTGNGCGSYTFNRNEAAHMIADNLDLLAEACAEFGCDMDVLSAGAEACDVTIRCYLLSTAIGEILDEIAE